MRAPLRPNCFRRRSSRRSLFEFSRLMSTLYDASKGPRAFTACCAVLLRECAMAIRALMMAVDAWSTAYTERGRFGLLFRSGSL